MSKTDACRVRAVNTAADSENRIHGDAVAAVYGFHGGLVPGVTVYGYMMAAAIAHFGEEWLERGAARARFKEPVYEGEDVSVEALEEPGGGLAITLEHGRATALAWIERTVAPPDVAEYRAAPLPSPDHRALASPEVLAVGSVLGTLPVTINLAESRMSMPLAAAVGKDRAAHPAILLALANETLVRNVVLGPWIHVSSEVVNFAQVRDGDALELRARVVEQYQRKGHDFVTLDALLIRHGCALMHVRHTAIWRLRAPAPEHHQACQQ